MGGSRSRPSRPVELEESPTSRSFTRQVPFNDEEPASPSSPPWTPLGPVSPGTGSLSLGGRQFFGRSSGPSSPEPSPLSPKSQSSKSSRPFLARSWSALSLGGKKDEPQELTEFLRQVPLLKCLPRAKVSLLTEVASVQKFAPGA
ncbi:cGMP-dependent protein kinase [Durusdinium trenchii]|uniref:cGMP-dependent protein kinase n=1 Tax=Durusdinium trenchii TaxID=1381693 RepID=A0ABP0Q799_9DINO